MTPKLHGAILLLDEEIPDWLDCRLAWQAIRPAPGYIYLRGSFWRVLADALPYAKSERQQDRIAAFIERRYATAKKTGGHWPPLHLTINSFSYAL